MTTPTDTLTQLRRDLSTLRLPAEEWDRLTALAEESDLTDAASVDALAQAVFEARVQRRFEGGRAASTLPPTKAISILPWVGIACALLLLAVGRALGGGLVFAGVAALSFGVFVVAFAGSRVAHRRRDRGSADGDMDAAPPAPRQPVPNSLLERLGGTVEP